MALGGGGRRGPAKAAAALLALSIAATGCADEGSSAPDIVVIYLDDVSPHDGRLWSSAERTPTLAMLFAEQGVELTAAVSETPLCAPGRAGTLTGRHSRHHGVRDNVTAPFDPTTTIGTELQGVGYSTAYLGKYLNELRSEVRPAEVSRYAVGWDVFDVVYADNGRYRDYDLWTRKGLRRRGAKDSDHSTTVATRAAVRHLRALPAGTPGFVFVSLLELHLPNTPLERYEDDPRCRSMEPWRPPSFDEDVADKPASIRTRPALGTDGWSMRTYCEQMLAVDGLARSIVDEQRRRGRLDDTLFVLTADNGITWGEHRLGRRKQVPYATPVPLIFSWPRRWGRQRRTVDELVSNIDLAPTLCAITGCEMGPFRHGPRRADGVDLLPLLDGQVTELGRTVVREEGARGSVPRFRAIRTSAQHQLGRWHYVEYGTGELELYDSEQDPWELENRATDPAYAKVVRALAKELRAEFS